MLLQLGGVGLGVALGKNPAMANQVLQAYGIVGGVGVALPFGRSQETEADRIGLILMAKAGYDPRVAVDLWQRMESRWKRRMAPRAGRQSFFRLTRATKPGCKIFVRSCRKLCRIISRATRDLKPLPSPESLDTPAAKSERELLKRIEAINRAVEQQNGERAVVEALAYELRLSPQSTGSGAAAAPDRLWPVRGVARCGVSWPRFT